MGTWGTGPFDGDEALDFLANLAGSVAGRDDETDIDPNLTDRSAVVAKLRETLCVAIALSSDSEDVWFNSGVQGHAAAGLVAAALTGLSGQPSTGTRLLEALTGERDTTDPCHLTAHCGYAVLLDLTTARELLPLAQELVTVMLTAPAWQEALNDFKDPDEFRGTILAVNKVFQDR